MRSGNTPPGTWGQRNARSPGDGRPLTCRSQLLWPNLRSSGEVRFPRRLRNCFHRHTYFSVKSRWRSSALLGDFPLPSTPGRQRGAGRGKGETVGQSARAGRARFSSPERHTHTSDGKTLLPGVIGCLGVPLEPELGLGVDLIAVRPHGGEGLDRDVLQEEGRRVSGPRARLSCRCSTAGLPRGRAQARSEGQRSRLLCPVCVPVKHSIQFSRSIPTLSLGSLTLPVCDWLPTDTPTATYTNSYPKADL